MGKISGINAWRIDRGRSALVGGGYEQVYELRIENLLDKAVSPIVDEQPPTTLAWSVIKANESFEQLDRRLVFRPSIKPKSTAVIQYTLRVTIPES